MGILNDMNKGCPSQSLMWSETRRIVSDVALIVEGESVKSVEGKLFHNRLMVVLFELLVFPRDLYIDTDVETIWCFW